MRGLRGKQLALTHPRCSKRPSLLISTHRLIRREIYGCAGVHKIELRLKKINSSEDGASLSVRIVYASP